MKNCAVVHNKALHTDKLLAPNLPVSAALGVE